MVWVASGPERHGVWITASVQQEVLVLHIRKCFRVEGHADKVEVGIEAVDLKRILHVVVSRPVAVVVGIVLLVARRAVAAGPGIDALPAGSGLLHRMSVGSHFVRGSPCCARSGAIEAAAGRHAVLSRPHIDLAHHAHLQVLGRRDVAVPEVSARVRRQDSNK